MIIHQTAATAYPTTLYSSPSTTYPWIYTTPTIGNNYQPSDASGGGVSIDVKFFTNGNGAGVSCVPN
jgi:hypothetical protein